MIRWMFTHIDVSRSTHCAIHNLTGAPSSRASPDVCGSPPYPVWLPAGVPHLVAVCGGPHADRNCDVPVVLTLQRVPDCASVSRRERGHTHRSRWSALHRCTGDHLDALAHALAGCHTQKSPACLWLVPHPVELCDPRRDASGHTRPRGLGGNRATL